MTTHLFFSFLNNSGLLEYSLDFLLFNELLPELRGTCPDIVGRKSGFASGVVLAVCLRALKFS